MQVRIDFHFDFLSPYAYLAWTRIHGLAERYGASVRPVPTLLAALLASGGAKGPAEIPAKRAYIFLDTLRSARALGVPLTPPPSHPFKPLLALRAASMVEGDAQRALIDALFAATWGGGEGVDTDEKVEAAARAAGLDGAHVVEAAHGEEAKQRLREATELAIAAGIFGVPTMRVGEGATGLFWGLDALPALERRLRGEENVHEDDLRRWAALPATARRAQG